MLMINEFNDDDYDLMICKSGAWYRYCLVDVVAE